MCQGYWMLRRAALADVDGDLGAYTAIVAEAERTGEPDARYRVNRELGYIALERGDVATALRLSDTAQIAGRREDADWDLRFRLVVLAAAERYEEARQLFEELESRPRPGFLNGWVLLSTVDAALRAGIDPDRVLQFAAAEPAIDGYGQWMQLASACCALVAGRPAEAANLFDEVFSGDADLALPASMRASMREAAARACIACGRAARARDHAAAAVQELANWSSWRRERAETTLARLRRVSPAGDDSVVALSSREREVAALVAEGLTNAELARRLYISPKTAAVHVSNILTKLGLGSRAEIAAWSVRNAS
jgi:DNA-binding CsgD family transcriptional regulator